jgi:arylsulfatase A-like enzyme
MESRPTPIGFWGYDWKPERENKRWLTDNAMNEMITMTAKQKATLKKRPDAKWYFKNHQHPVAKTSFGGSAAWMDGRYKLVVSRGKKANRYELYDLDADRGEANDIASRQPEKVKRMVKQLNAWQQSVENSLTGADDAK